MAMTLSIQQGFTLVEVLVALVLITIVSLVSWEGLDSMVRVRDHVERDVSREQAAMNAMGQLATDIRMCAADQVIDATQGDMARNERPVLPLAATVQGKGGNAVLDVVRKLASGESGWQTCWWRKQGRLMRVLAPSGPDSPLPAP